MSTYIYAKTPISKDKIEDISKKNQELQLQWLIKEIIMPELPDIKDNLMSCRSRLAEEDDNIYRLPLSSHNSEILKGTITRQNFKIVGFNVSIKAKTFNGGKPFDLKLKSGASVIIRQLLDCHDSIDNSISTIDKLIENGNLDHLIFIKYMEQVYRHINLAKESLTKPNPAYIFPQYRIPSNLFDPPLPDLAALDVLVNNSELTIDFQSLALVTTKPWDTILDYQKRLSFADVVKNKISTDRSKPVTKIIADEYNKLLEWKKKQDSKHPDDSAIGSAFKTIFNSSGDPSLSTLLKTSTNFLSHSITYCDSSNNPIVVRINEKCEVITSDPILLSISTKLESLERSLLRMTENLKYCCC